MLTNFRRPVLARVRRAGPAPAGPDPPADRGQLRRQRRGRLHGQRRPRLPAADRAGRARRPGQPRAAGLGRRLRPVRGDRPARRRAARARSPARASLSVALSDVALATAGNLGFLAEAELGQTGPPARQLPLRRVRPRLHRRDGSRFMVVTLTARHWRDLVAATGLGEAALEKGPTASGPRRRGRPVQGREQLAALLEPWFRPRTWPRCAACSTRGRCSGYPTFAELVAGPASCGRTR